MATAAEKGAVLLNDGEEMGDQVLLRYHNRFSKQGPAFGSADIEHIAEPGYILEGYLITGAGEGIGQPRAVQEQRKTVFAAHAADLLEFTERIQRTVFRWL